MSEDKAARLSTLCGLIYNKLVLSDQAPPDYVTNEHRIILKTPNGAVYEITVKEKKGPTQ